MYQLSQASQNVCLQTAARSQSTIQEIDELLYQANKLADELPMNLSPLVRESLATNLTALVNALQMRGVTTTELIQQGA
jgi:hypothetical protein